MKRDPYKSKEKYLSWKEKVNQDVPELSRCNSKLVLRYLDDMEIGLNVAPGSKKGARSYIRLINVKQRLIFLIKHFQNIYFIDDITEISEYQLSIFFTKMRNGEFNGRLYKSVVNYVKAFKSFWHWYQRFQRKEGKDIPDITTDLDMSKDKPKWVYLTEDQVKELCKNAKYNYHVLIMFLLDTGIRSPTELMNVRVKDLFNDFKELQIREETSKTFGRRIKLLLCSDLIKDYIEGLNLDKEDYIFNICPKVVNRYLKRLGKNVLGDRESPAGQKYSELTMYDFRHISCCYWLPRYKSESALKYRFGWKNSDEIHYYSELLGMRDTITEEDLLVDATKTEIEKRLLKSENDKEVLQDRVNAMEEQIKNILKYVNVVEERVVCV